MYNMRMCTQICNTCDKELPIDKFYTRQRIYRGKETTLYIYKICIQCYLEYSKKYRKENKEKCNAAIAKWHKEHAEHCKKVHKVATKRWRENNKKRCYENAKRYDAEHKTERAYSAYKRVAKLKQREFSLSLEEFKVFIFNSCYYCGALPNPKNGIDRVDNNKGYVQGNMVSCCGTCNRLKLHLNVEYFILQCNKIANLHFRNLTNINVPTDPPIK